MFVRQARPDDAPQLVALYAPYVRETAITFEYDVPTEEEFRQRIIRISEHYPWLVVEDDGRIVGYAYAATFHERAAYQWAVETSIYIDMNQRRRGIGQLLHEALEQELHRRGILNMNACIAYVEHEDEYLTNDSIQFHKHVGYRQCAHFHQCGRKFNRWYDVIWMEKMIGEHKTNEE